MKKHLFLLIILTIPTFLAACAPATPAQPPVDTIGTRAAELASLMLTQTVAAYSPTPPPTFTPAPTATEIILPTPEPIHEPMVRNGPAPCYLKPDPSSVLSSNISDFKIVELLAISSIPGWYKITNPYFNTPCWIYEDYIDIDGKMDLSRFPIE